MIRPDWLDTEYSQRLLRQVGVQSESLPLLAGVAEDGDDIVVWFDTDDAECRFRGAALSL